MKTKIVIVFLICFLGAVGLAGAQTLVYDAQVMREVVDHYCRDTQPVASCGVYQEDIEFAQVRAAQFVQVIGNQPTGQQALLVEGMMERIARSFYTATDPRQKLVSARYYLYFNQRFDPLNTQKIGQLTDILYGYNAQRPLFTVTNPVQYQTRPYVEEYVQILPQQKTAQHVVTVQQPVVQQVAGSLRSISPLKSQTFLQGNVISSSSRTKDIDLRIHTGKAIRNSGYRVVATSRSMGNRVFAATYRSNGNWELRVRPSQSISDLTVYLLCQSCGQGTVFTEGTHYRNWRIVDKSSYRVGYVRDALRDSRIDRYDSRYDSRSNSRFNSRYNTRYRY